MQTHQTDQTFKPEIEKALKSRTGLAFKDLNAGTMMTVTAKNVKVSNPKSLMTSTALATSTTACNRNLLLSPDLQLEKNNFLRLKHAGTDVDSFSNTLLVA